jgi:hypothetical protein
MIIESGTLYPFGILKSDWLELGVELLGYVIQRNQV